MKSSHWFLLLMTLIGALNLPACDREGPMEEAGESVDEAGREMRDTMEGERRD